MIPRRASTGPTRPAYRAGAVALAGLALAAGCTRGNAAAPTTSASRPGATPSATAPLAAANPATGAPVPTTPRAAPSEPPVSTATGPAPDPTTTLTAALDALASGYHFVTTATVAGQVAVSAEGDHVAGATQMTITSGGATTQYLVTAGAAWAQADGEWQQLDSTQGLSDPVGQLRSPRSAELIGTTEAATIVAEYPAAVLGLPGERRHTVEFQLSNGRIVSLRYASTVQVTDADGTVTNQPADVTAVISPVAPGTQITLPDAQT